MSDPFTLITIATASLSGLGIAAFAGLKGWQGWLDLKRLELAGRRPDTNGQTAFERIEMAALKERIRKLETIAEVVDL
ncbi:hypothetical protein IC614_06175 [Allosphingosinicella flava]|uniref:Uncharacterized protein n=1 Tax=Allosphingosinicella flava TaxID=2771430 RepID=A0A7T2GLN1_9SPHN|nr:hypothetical protein [Sphingosinicella flava]QPQ56146.1 hypothetical protein IC614_06175 [Sphingosinicella flava]